LWDASHMVHVVMRHNQVVNLFDARQSGGGDNARRITALSIRQTGVHEHRLSRRRDEKRGLPALDIDEIHLQSFGSARRAEEKDEEQSRKGCSHNSR